MKRKNGKKMESRTTSKPHQRSTPVRLLTVCVLFIATRVGVSAAANVDASVLFPSSMSLRSSGSGGLFDSLKEGFPTEFLQQSPPAAADDKAAADVKSAEASFNPTASPTMATTKMAGEESKSAAAAAAPEAKAATGEQTSSDKAVAPAPHHRTHHRGHKEEVPVWTEHESLKDFYEEWLDYIIELIRGPGWFDQKKRIQPKELCSENLNLKQRGCALLVPTCTNYTAAGVPNAWTCEMVAWRACSCSKGYSSFLRYMVPKFRDCYGDALHTNALAELIPNFDKEKSSGGSHAIIPLGHCAVSGSFVVYCFALLVALIALASIIWSMIPKHKTGGAERTSHGSTQQKMHPD